MSMIFTTVNPINKEELGKEFITIRVAINTSVCVKTTKCMDMVFIFGKLLVIHTKGTGLQTKELEKV